MSDMQINPIGRVGLQPSSGSYPMEDSQPKPAGPAPRPMRSTRLSFQVSTTDEVTIMVLDQESGKVIRTIPSEAIKDLPAGDLFEYSS